MPSISLTKHWKEWIYVLVDDQTSIVATALVLSLLNSKPQFELMTTRDNGTILLFKREE